jgi:hypothetical protein
VNIALWGSESWALKKQTGPNWKLSTMDVSHKMCGLTMWDVAEKRITNEHVRGMVANSPDGHVDGNAKMLALQTQCNGRVKISGECLAHGVRRQDQ